MDVQEAATRPPLYARMRMAALSAGDDGMVSWTIPATDAIEIADAIEAVAKAKASLTAAQERASQAMGVARRLHEAARSERWGWFWIGFWSFDGVLTAMIWLVRLIRAGGL